METKGKVDVLEVITEQLSMIDPTLSEEDAARYVDLIWARKLIAELIDAAQSILYSGGRSMVEIMDNDDMKRKRLASALSVLRSSQGGPEGDEGEGRDMSHT